jgi:hypothetical protein
LHTAKGTADGGVAGVTIGICMDYSKTRGDKRGKIEASASTAPPTWLRIPRACRQRVFTANRSPLCHHTALTAVVNRGGALHPTPQRRATLLLGAGVSPKQLDVIASGFHDHQEQITARSSLGGGVVVDSDRRWARAVHHLMHTAEAARGGTERHTLPTPLHPHDTPTP